MPTQDPLTMRQVRTIREDGGAELVTGGEAIQPGRHSFTRLDAADSPMDVPPGDRLSGYR
jgi:hypothetical protein